MLSIRGSDFQRVAREYSDLPPILGNTANGKVRMPEEGDLPGDGRLDQGAEGVPGSLPQLSTASVAGQ